MRAADGSIRELKTKEVGVIIHPGDTLLAESAGGGGLESRQDGHRKLGLRTLLTACQRMKQDMREPGVSYRH